MGVALDKRIGRSGSRLSLLSKAVAVAVFAIGMATPTLVLAQAAFLPDFQEMTGRVRESVVTVASAVLEKDNKRGAPSAQDVKSEREDESPGMGDFTLGLSKRAKNGYIRRVSSIGSGFIIDASGLVVTNNHVIEGGEEIFVVFPDGTELKVDKIVGRDPKTDLTLLKVTPKADKPLRAVQFGDSKAMRVGDWAIAIGNPFGLKGTVTAGIISGIGRDINAGPYDDFIQTDAAINRGNSGGPLFNTRGEVIGINTAIFSPSGGSIGIGFAIPSSVAQRVVKQLQAFGETQWAFMGVRLQTVTNDLAPGLGLARTEGALVARVDPGGPAEAAGLLEGDVIVTLGATTIRTAREVPRILSRMQVGDETVLEVVRNKSRKTLPVKLSSLTEKTAGRPIVKVSRRRQRTGSE